jgi:mono/diheme cytochrome c family protein
MKRILLFLFPLPLVCGIHNLQAQNTGEEIFKSVCSACHTIKMGRKVGPDLTGVYTIRNNEWLIRFIRSSQTFIKSGDTAALAIYEEYNHIPMPDNQLSDEKILSVIEFIKATDQKASAAAGQPKANDSLKYAGIQSKVSNDSINLLYPPEKVSEGKSLFYGYTRFTNGASPCITCHNIRDQSVMGGGKLALDLTGDFIKLGPVGLKAILTSPPFPAMKTAMLNHDLTENEIQAVISLLKSAGDQKYSYKIRDSAGLFFFSIGFVSALLLLAIIYILYDNRKIPDSFT